MTDINIKETITDKSSPFNIKIFQLSGLGKDFLVKTIDINSTKKSIIENKERGDLKNKKIIFEKSKIIKDFDNIKNLIETDNKKDVNDFFGRQAWLNDRYNLFHATLKFNPYNKIKSVEEISGFLNYYYSYSKNIIFIPNVIKNYTPYDKETKKKGNRVEIIGFDDYIKLVDELYDFFENMNNKPIFVPISLKFSIGDVKKLVEYYLKKERYYFWIDFETYPVNENISAQIREINATLRNSKYFDKCLLFVTNIKREIISHSKLDKSPASDILGMLCGANLVGVDRDPQKGGITPPEDPEKLKLLRQHKARIFDPNTYYYLKPKDQVISKEQNITDNSVLLSYEFDKQKKKFLEKSEIKSYLGTKDMIKEHHKGKLLKEFSLDEGGQKTLF